MSCSPPASTTHGILQVRILKKVAISFCRRSSWSRDQTWVSCIAGRLFTIWATIKIHNTLSCLAFPLVFAIQHSYISSVLDLTNLSVHTSALMHTDTLIYLLVSVTQSKFYDSRLITGKNDLQILSIFYFLSVTPPSAKISKSHLQGEILKRG